MIRTSVSHLDMYSAFRDDEDYPLEVFVSQLRSPEATEAMLRGRAFARALERAPELTETDVLVQDGYTFAFTGNFTIESFPRREESREKDYGGIIVAARADRALGKLIIDDKSSSTFDAERYLDKLQWRFYLDMWEADVFKWFIWETKEIKGEEKAYEVFNMHPLVQYRYPGLEKDCRDIAQDFKQFAERFMPGYPYPRQTEPVPAPPAEPAWQMIAARGVNLIAVGWRDGLLRIAFASKDGSRFYLYPMVSQEHFRNLVNSPFPDKLWVQYREKYGYKGELEKA